MLLIQLNGIQIALDDCRFKRFAVTRSETTTWQGLTVDPAYAADTAFARFRRLRYPAMHFWIDRRCDNLRLYLLNCYLTSGRTGLACFLLWLTRRRRFGLAANTGFISGVLRAPVC